MKQTVPLLVPLSLLLVLYCILTVDPSTSSDNERLSSKTARGEFSPGVAPNGRDRDLARQTKSRNQEFSHLSSHPIPGDGKPGGATTRQPVRSAHGLADPSLGTLSDEDLLARLPEKERRSLARYRKALEISSPEARAYICWSPGTAPEIVEAYRRVEREFGLLAGKTRLMAEQFLGIGHWSKTATDGSGQGIQGLPVTVTWSIVPDGTPAPDRFGGAATPSNLRAWLAGIYGTAGGGVEAQPWFPLVQEAFDNIATQSGLRLVYEPNDDGTTITNFSSGEGQLGVRGDIRISARAIDGDFGVLAFAYSPSYGDVVIDSTDVFFNTTSSNSIRFINTLTHELGHSLGLGHVCPINQTKLMEPFVSTAFRGCQFDDTYSLQRLYADELEVHGGLRNNDTAGNATPISLTPGTLSTWRWLSNDDSEDVDYLQFSALAGQELTVRVIPSDPIAPTDPDVDTYLEGAQNTDGSCSNGTDFDPTTRQDLTLEVLAGNGSTVLASSTSAPAGESESIDSFVLPTAGAYYLRINGGSADASQLYELEVLVVTATSAPRLQVDSTRLVRESNSGGNGVADPGETIQLGVTVSNQGDLNADNLVATLTGPGAFTGFETTANLSSLATAASAELLFTFAPDGSCGDTVQLTLDLAMDGGYTGSLTIPLEFGAIGSGGLINEGFDDDPGLPSGWGQSVINGGSNWVVSTTRADNSLQSAFSAGVLTAGEARLVSPTMAIGQSGASLSFQHYYDLQSKVDGAVLEASLEGGSWFDLMNSAATVVSGGYNSSIRGNVSTSLQGAAVWSGSSGGFVATAINLPSAWAGQQVQFRWRVVHDSNVAGEGWFLDTVSYDVSGVPVCDPFNPFVSLAVSETSLTENDPASTVTLTLSTPLPLASDVTVMPDLSGTADASDLAAMPILTIIAGQTSGQFTLEAVDEGASEGEEDLTLSIPIGNLGFTPASPSSVTVKILESDLLPATVTLGDLAQTYDGSPKSVTATTNPAGLSVAFTYDDSDTAPTDAGSYAVEATVTDPNYTGSASGTLVITISYAIWMETFISPAPSPVDDTDKDGWSNLSEYLFDTDPSVAGPTPSIVRFVGESIYELRLSSHLPRPDAVIGAQTSIDLDTWTTIGVNRTPAGFAVSNADGERFLRISFSLNE